MITSDFKNHINLFMGDQTLCSLLECLLTEDNTPADSPRELYEIYFVFACVWAFGGALFQDHVCDYSKF